MIDDRPGRQLVKFGELGVELTEFVLSPDRRAELVVGDRGQHEEPGVGRVQAGIQPVGTLYGGFLFRAPETMWSAPVGSGHSGRPEH